MSAVAELRALAAQIDPCLVGGADAKLLLRAASELETALTDRDAALRWQDVRLQEIDADNLRVWSAEARAEELEKALAPFAKAIEPDSTCVSGWRFGVKPTSDDFIRARRALSHTLTEEGNQ